MSWALSFVYECRKWRCAPGCSAWLGALETAEDPGRPSVRRELETSLAIVPPSYWRGAADCRAPWKPAALVSVVSGSDSVDCEAMESFDRLRALLAATDCPVCGRPIDPARIRILAQRDDLTFVELPCLACGVVALGMVTVAPEPIPRRYGEFTAADEARFAGRPPISADDLLAAHELLASWQGDLRGLLGDGPPRASGSDGGSAGAGAGSEGDR